MSPDLCSEAHRSSTVFIVKHINTCQLAQNTQFIHTVYTQKIILSFLEIDFFFLRNPMIPKHLNEIICFLIITWFFLWKMYRNWPVMQCVSVLTWFFRSSFSFPFQDDALWSSLPSSMQHNVNNIVWINLYNQFLLINSTMISLFCLTLPLYIMNVF